MHRNRFIVAALALGGLVGAAEVRSTLAEQQQRLQAFQAKAQAARKAQKLDGNREALVSKYPTPEIEFSKTVEARGGSELTLSVTGRFVPDSLVLVPCEGVEVLSTQVTKQRAEARVRVRPNALPAECDLEVISPVSAISRSTQVLRIKGDYVWNLKLANGMTTRWKVSLGEDGTTLIGQSEWSDGKGKSLGTRNIVIDPTGSEVRASVQVSDEEAGAVEQAGTASSADMEALGKKMDALMTKMKADCAKAPADQQPACMEKYQPQMEALSQEAQTNAQKAQGTMSAVSAVCTDLRLQAVGGVVSGTADNCNGRSGVKVTGTYQPAPVK